MTTKRAQYSTAGSRLSIGYVPLVDASPLVAGLEWGHFREAGLEVALSREVGWATVRDKLIFGELDAVHAPAPMAFSIGLGWGCAPTPVSTAWVLSRQGNAITLSRELANRGVTGASTFRALARSILPRKLTMAVVARHSMHALLMTRWLALAGLDPARDVRLVVIPPPQMVGSLAAGVIDGFCAGEPWNSEAVARGCGWCPATSAELMPGHMEKVLLVRREFAESRPEEHAALLRGMRQAARTCESPEGRAALPELLARKYYLSVSASVLAASLVGPFDRGDGSATPHASPLHIFHRDNTPSVAEAADVWAEMARCGMIPSAVRPSPAALASLFRQDLQPEVDASPSQTPKRPRRHAKLAA